jgi:hypothetical protein
MPPKKFTIICGQSGCGKTNLSINLAIDAAAEGHFVTLVDLDIVNPYFRSSGYAEALAKKGIQIIGPVFTASGSDLPMLSPEVSSIFYGTGMVIIDVGGDAAGATALGRYAQKVKMLDYELLFVINMYRSINVSADGALALLREIEGACGLKATAVVNNSHLMWETTTGVIADSLVFAQAVSEISGLPIRFTTIPKGGNVQNVDYGDVYPVDIYVRQPW